MAPISKATLPPAEIAEAWLVINDAAEWAKLDVNIVGKLLALLGDSELDDIGTFVSVDVGDVKKAMKELNLYPILKGKCARMVNGMRVKYDLVPVDLFEDGQVVQPGLVAQGGGRLPALPSEPTHMVKVSLATVIDQGMNQDVPLLTDEVLTVKRRKYWIMGDAPLPEHDATDEQLTALSFVVAAGRPP